MFNVPFPSGGPVCFRFKIKCCVDLSRHFARTQSVQQTLRDKMSDVGRMMLEHWRQCLDPYGFYSLPVEFLDLSGSPMLLAPPQPQPPSLPRMLEEAEASSTGTSTSLALPSAEVFDDVLSTVSHPREAATEPPSASTQKAGPDPLQVASNCRHASFFYQVTGDRCLWCWP